MSLYNKNITKKKDNPMVLSKDRELSLIERHNNGDADATVSLISSMEHVVNHMVNNISKSHQDKEDLYQVAMIGCIRGIDAFNVDKNTRLSTISKFYIKAELDDHLNKSSRPARVYRTVDERKVFFNALKLTPENTDPLGVKNIQMLSEELNVDAEIVNDVLGMIIQGNPEMPDEFKLGDTGDECLSNLTKSRNNRILAEKLGGLTELEFDVINRSFFGDEVMRTIGESYNLSPQRIQVIKDNALTKLKRQMKHDYDGVVNA